MFEFTLKQEEIISFIERCAAQCAYDGALTEARDIFTAAELMRLFFAPRRRPNGAAPCAVSV